MNTVTRWLAANAGMIFLKSLKAILKTIKLLPKLCALQYIHDINHTYCVH